MVLSFKSFEIIGIKKRNNVKRGQQLFYKNIGTYLPTLWNSSRHIFLTGDIKINYITNLKHKNIPAQLLKGLYPFPLDKHLFNYNYFCQLVVRIHQRHTMSLQECDKKKHFWTTPLYSLSTFCLFIKAYISSSICLVLEYLLSGNVWVE